MFWRKLETADALEELLEKSYEYPQVIFKHSTRCSISSLAFNRMQSVLELADYHILNVISNRALSNQLAERTGVQHQSPQLLIISKGACVYNTSHLGIAAEEVNRQLELLKSNNAEMS